MEHVKIDSLITEILKIPGDKILTLNSNDNIFQIDISKDGSFGYESGHEDLFHAKLINGLINEGSIIIREFLLLKQKRTMPNGKDMWIPEKNLYGIQLGEGRWIGLDAEILQQLTEMDAETGESLPQEEGVHYQAFPIRTTDV